MSSPKQKPSTTACWCCDLNRQTPARGHAAASGRPMNGALAVSLGAHSVVVAIWLVLQTVPAPNPAPQVAAEVELVLGSGGQVPAEAEAADGQDQPAQPPG